MDDAALAAREHRSQAAYYRLLAGGHPASRVVAVRPDVQATVVPATPARSLPNAVIYDDPANVIEAHADLCDLFAGAGVTAWTVWVRPEDDDLAGALAERGHAVDGTPAIMAAEIADIDLEPRVDLDLDPGADWDVVGALNDAAYGLPAGTLAPAMAGLGPDVATALVARVGGRHAACAGFHVHDGDVAVEFVATLPEFRGLGLAPELLREGLRRASAASGATTTSLESSKMGEPVYTRLGYRTLGRLRMLERRAA